MTRNVIISWVLFAVGLQMILLKVLGFLILSWVWVLSPFYLIIASIIAVFVKGFLIAWRANK